MYIYRYIYIYRYYDNIYYDNIYQDMFINIHIYIYRKREIFVQVALLQGISCMFLHTMQ